MSPFGTSGIEVLHKKYNYTFLWLKHREIRIRKVTDIEASTINFCTVFFIFTENLVNSNLFFVLPYVILVVEFLILGNSSRFLVTTVHPFRHPFPRMRAITLPRFHCYRVIVVYIRLALFAEQIDPTHCLESSGR